MKSQLIVFASCQFDNFSNIDKFRQLGKSGPNVDTPCNSWPWDRIRRQWLASRASPQSCSAQGPTRAYAHAGRCKEDNGQSRVGPSVYTRKDLGNPSRGQNLRTSSSVSSTQGQTEFMRERDRKRNASSSLYIFIGVATFTLNTKSAFVFL